MRPKTDWLRAKKHHTEYQDFRYYEGGNVEDAFMKKELLELIEEVMDEPFIDVLFGRATLREAQEDIGLSYRQVLRKYETQKQQLKEVLSEKDYTKQEVARLLFS